MKHLPKKLHISDTSGKKNDLRQSMNTTNEIANLLQSPLHELRASISQHEASRGLSDGVDSMDVLKVFHTIDFEDKDNVEEATDEQIGGQMIHNTLLRNEEMVLTALHEQVKEFAVTEVITQKQLTDESKSIHTTQLRVIENECSSLKEIVEDLPEGKESDTSSLQNGIEQQTVRPNIFYDDSKSNNEVVALKEYHQSLLNDVAMVKESMHEEQITNSVNQSVIVDEPLVYSLPAIIDDAKDTARMNEVIGMSLESYLSSDTHFVPEQSERLEDRLGKDEFEESVRHESGVDRMGKLSDARYEKKTSNNSTTNIIQMNKPLIEQLTINVRDTNEGVTRVRKAVEEALMEILDTVIV